MQCSCKNIRLSFFVNDKSGINKLQGRETFKIIFKKINFLFKFCSSDGNIFLKKLKFLL